MEEGSQTSWVVPVHFLLGRSYDPVTNVNPSKKVNFNNAMLLNYGTYRYQLHTEDGLRGLENTSEMWFVSVRAVVDAFYTIENVDQFFAGIEPAEPL